MVVNRVVIFLLLHCVCIAVLGSGDAGNYWLVGGSSNRATAIAEGERLSSATGVEVLLQSVDKNGSTSYRLLVRFFTDEYDQLRLKSQLRFAGVAEVIPTKFTGSESELQSLFAVLDYGGEVLGSSEPSPMAATENTFPGEPAPQSISVPEPIRLPGPVLIPGSASGAAYLVVGSFRRSEQAEKYRESLESSFSGVFIKLSSEHSFYRVVVGPVAASEEEVYKREATAEGIEGAWMLRGGDTLDAVETVSSDSIAGVSPSPEPSPETVLSPKVKPDSSRETGPASPEPEDDSYNLAELKAASGGFFLNPKR